jgi:anaphase-promoting complex subunit 4
MELIKENLIPAVDRCTIILSNLQGLAQYHEHSPAFDVPVSSFLILLDITRCIRLISHHVLLICSREYQCFAAFSKWLRYVIEMQSADPNSAVGEEIIDRDPGVDYSLLLSYIKGAMVQTDIDLFIGNPSTESSLKADLNMYENLRESFKNLAQRNHSERDVLDLPSYYKEWQRHNRLLIEQVTSWQRKNTIIPGTLSLPNSGVSCCDVRMISEDSGQSGCISSYVLAVSSTQKSKGNTTHLFSGYVQLTSTGSDAVPNRSSRVI